MSEEILPVLPDKINEQPEKIPEKIIKTNFFEKLGTKAGVVTTILGLMAAAAGGGSWLKSIQKDKEIIIILNDQSIHNSEKSEEISDLKAEIRTLKFKRMQDSIINYINGKKSE